jgi:hypothetical protein
MALLGRRQVRDLGDAATADDAEPDGIGQGASSSNGPETA